MKQSDIKNMIPVTRPYFPLKVELQKYIDKIYDNQYMTNNGPLHRELESKLKEYLGVENLTLVVNGHAGLDIALKSLGISGEVITTPFTFVSTTHALVMNRIRPVFCDIGPKDLTINVEKIEELVTPETTAIMPVHVYGHMCNVERIGEIARRHNLKVIYDAAHAFGVKYKDRALASYGDVAMLSFHATKIFNTIEGGALVYGDDGLSRIFDAYKNFGIEGPETVEFIGGNAKMNEFQAAVGLASLGHMPNIIMERKALTDLYRELLDEVSGISYFVPEKLYDDYEYNYAYLPILVDEVSEKNRDGLYEYLLDYKIYARKYFYPIVTELDCYRERFKDVNLPVAEEAGRKVLCLPLYNGLASDEVRRICKLVKEYMEGK